MSSPSMPMRSFPFLALCLVACGGASTPAPVTPAQTDAPDDHWETLSDLQLVSPVRCATGPYEIAIPAREVAWGRRIVVEIHGPRGLPLRNRLDTPDFMQQWGIGITEHEGDHSHCRARTGEGASATSVTATAPPIDLESAPRSEPGVTSLDEPPDGYPTLEPFEGELPPRVQLGANAWFPHGDPWFYADEFFSITGSPDRAGSAWRFRFWFDEPVDMDGIVIRVREQILVPDLPEGEYRVRFAARVRDADARREQRRREMGTPTSSPEAQARVDEINARYQRCVADPTRTECFDARSGRLPPAPLEPTPPPAPPGRPVVWLPGYWIFNHGLDAFLWLEGTYVVREDPEPRVTVVAPEPAPPPPVIAAEPAAPREMAPSIPPRPEPRVETIPPAPAIPGATWVPGHWRLEGRAWAWTEGAWQLPPRAGMRPRAPTITERQGLRIYFPGGWIDIGP